MKGHAMVGEPSSHFQYEMSAVEGQLVGTIGKYARGGMPHAGVEVFLPPSKDITLMADDDKTARSIAMMHVNYWAGWQEVNSLAPSQRRMFECMRISMGNHETDKPNVLGGYMFTHYPGIVLRRTTNFPFKGDDVSVHYQTSVAVPEEYLERGRGYVVLSKNEATLAAPSVGELLSSPKAKRNEFIGVDLEQRNKAALEFFVMDGSVGMYPTNIAMFDPDRCTPYFPSPGLPYFTGYTPGEVSVPKGGLKEHQQKMRRSLFRRNRIVHYKLRRKLVENIRQLNRRYDGVLVTNLVVGESPDPDQPFRIRDVSPEKLVDEILFELIGVERS